MTNNLCPPVEVAANVLGYNNSLHPNQQPCYVYMQYDVFKSLVELTSPPVAGSGINPEFPPHFVFPLIKGLSSELSVVVSRDLTFTSDAIIGSVRIPLHNVLSRGYEDHSWSLHKGNDHGSAGDIRVNLLCLNTSLLQNPEASSSSSSTSRETPPPALTYPLYGYAPPSPHGYPPPPATYFPYGYAPPSPHGYPPPPATYFPYGYVTPPPPPPPHVHPQPYHYSSPLATYGYAQPPHVYPQAPAHATYHPHGYPPPRHDYHPHGAYNYPPPASRPSLLQGLLVAASLTPLLDNLFQYLGGHEDSGGT